MNPSALGNHRARRSRYSRELYAALALYAVVLVGALVVGPHAPAGGLRTAVYASPMLPFLLTLWVVVRQFRRSDEFIRKTVLEQLAITAAVTAGWTFTYGFFEIAGYPKLSMFMVWPVMGAVWGLLAVADHLRHR